MQRFAFLTLAVPLVVVGCYSFKNQRTPSGDFCSDMPILPAGQDADAEYHRLQPISSDPLARTEAQRLESLRKAACAVGGDAVIEAVNEEVRGENATYATVSSGTAVIWVRRPTTSNPRPLSLPTKKAATDASASATPDDPPPVDTSAAPAKSGTPVAPPAASVTPLPPLPSASAVASATPLAPPAKSAKPPVKPPVPPKKK